jgi:hypothetical protein
MPDMQYHSHGAFKAFRPLRKPNNLQDDMSFRSHGHTGCRSTPRSAGGTSALEFVPTDIFLAAARPGMKRADGVAEMAMPSASIY